MQKINKFIIDEMVKAQLAINKFLNDEKGEANIIAMILILVIVISLVIIFREQLQEIVTKIWDNINKNVDAANGNVTY